MIKSKSVFLIFLCSVALALAACGMWSDRDRGSRQGSSRGSASSSQATSGQSKSQISEVQQALKAKGYDPGSTDGVMGSQTQEALRKFQQANGLPVTGNIDAQTAKALGLSASGSTSSSRDSSTGGSSGSSSGARGSGSSSSGTSSGTGSSGSSGGSRSSGGSSY